MMELKDFLGKVVIHAQTKRRYALDAVDGAFISVREEKASANGTYAHYRWRTGTLPDDHAIANGTLVFEDVALTQPFLRAYRSYCNGAGKLDGYDYYMSKYD